MAAADAASSAPKKAASKKPKTKPTHPSTSEMVMAAIRANTDRKGSSLIAIKKSIAANNKVDVNKHLTLLIRKFLKKATAEGLLIQPKGLGATGSFKLPVAEKKAAKKPKAVTPKKAKKAPAAKKTKATATKKPKAKKTTKSPKKPKAPKPKKAVSKPKAKKAAPKKK